MRCPRTTLKFLIVASLAVAAFACAKPPTEKIKTAREALDAANIAEATEYAPDAWAAAQEIMTTAETEIATQDAKLALLRSYTKATELLSKAENLARVAESAGKEGRDKARAEAESALTEVRSDLDAAGNLLTELEACPRRPKGFASDLELLKGDLQGLVDTVPDIEEAFNNGELREVQSLASSLQAGINTIVTDLASAKAKINC